MLGKDSRNGAQKDEAPLLFSHMTNKTSYGLSFGVISGLTSGLTFGGRQPVEL